MRLSNYLKLRFFARLLGVWGYLLLIAPHLSWAVGTRAGTAISNVATLSYNLAGAIQSPVTSTPAIFKVDEIIYPVLTWQDATPVAVNTPGINNALTFLLTNSGNGQEVFGVTRTNGPAPLPAGNYTPLNGTLGSIYLENGLQSGFQVTGPNADTTYVPGVNDPNLASDAGQIIYVVSDTPSVLINARGDVLLSIASLTTGTAGAAPGTSLAGLGQGGGFAVVGTTRAQASAIGTYIATGLGLMVNKTVINVLDPNGTAVPMPGAVMTYQIAIAIPGVGTATNLVITDPLPSEITYMPGSIVVAGVAKTDSADADNAQFIANTVSVSLGNVAAPANFVITFRATIN